MGASSPPTFIDVWFDDAEDGQHHKVEPDGPDGEPQVHLEDAQDGQPHNMDPTIEVASAGRFHSCAIADSLHGSEDVDGEDSPPACSHGSFSDPELMGPNAQWKCVFLEANFHEFSPFFEIEIKACKGKNNNTQVTTTKRANIKKTCANAVFC